MPIYRANFGDGTWTKGFPVRRDALLAKWGRAGIVQYRTSIEVSYDPEGIAETRRTWKVHEPAQASLNGPPITEKRG